MNETAVLKQIPIGQLVESQYNPRNDFQKSGIEELTASVRVQGVIVPLLVRPLHDADTTPEKYEVIAGARRYRAAKAAKLESVPAIVRELGDIEAREAQIVENLQRTDIAPLEEAQGFQNLFKARNGGLPPATYSRSVIGPDGKAKIVPDEAAAKLDVKGLAERVGKSERYVYARLELLKLSAPAQKALREEKITAGHAAELVPLSPELQKAMLAEIEQQARYGNSTSVMDLRDTIESRYSPQPKPARYVPSKAEKARQAAFAVEQKKSSEKREREQKLLAAARPRILAAIAAKVKTISKWSEEHYFEYLLWEADGDSCAAITGKQMSNVAVHEWFQKQKPEVRAAVLVQLAASMEYGTTLAEVTKAHGIDLKAILAAAAKGLKDAEKAQATASAKKAAVARGTCRICGCTEDKACEISLRNGKGGFGGCSWTDKSQTLCNNPKCVKAARLPTSAKAAGKGK